MSTGSKRTLLYPVYAEINGRRIAESSAALRTEAVGVAPELWFPVDDVQADALANAPHRRGIDDLADYVTFTEPVNTSIVDVIDANDPRSSTLKRFPNWGDTADLIELLDMETVDETSYRSAVRSTWNRPIVEGSHMLGQAVLAAMRRSGGRRVVSASMIFARPVDDRAPYFLELDEVANGRTFNAVRSAVTQAGRTCAFGTLLLDVTAADTIRHSDPAPTVPEPYECDSFDMSVTGRDLRVRDNAYTGDPNAPVGPPELSCWVRFRSVPDDQAIHAGLLAQFTGHMSIVAALRPHAGIGQSAAHDTLSTAINAISLSIHEDVRADQWMLYHHRSTYAGNGMTHSECRVFDDSMKHIASFTVEAMVRGFDASRKNNDPRTAM